MDKPCFYCTRIVITGSDQEDWAYGINPDESTNLYHIECLEVFGDAILVEVKEWTE